MSREVLRDAAFWDIFEPPLPTGSPEWAAVQEVVDNGGTLQLPDVAAAGNGRRFAITFRSATDTCVMLYAFLFISTASTSTSTWRSRQARHQVLAALHSGARAAISNLQQVSHLGMFGEVSHQTNL